MPDRAALTARSVMEIFAALLHEKEEFYHRLEQLLRDEFAEEQRQAIADRSLDPDA